MFIVAAWFGFYRYEGATRVSKEAIIAIPADPDDVKDRAVSQAGLVRAQMGRRIRKLRNRLGLWQAEFAERYSIPLANIRQSRLAAHCRQSPCAPTSR